MEKYKFVKFRDIGSNPIILEFKKRNFNYIIKVVPYFNSSLRSGVPQIVNL